MGERIIGKDKTCKVLSNRMKRCPVMLCANQQGKNDDTERKCKTFQHYMSLLLLTCHRHPLSHVVKGQSVKRTTTKHFQLTRLQKLWVALFGSMNNAVINKTG